MESIVTNGAFGTAEVASMTLASVPAENQLRKLTVPLDLVQAEPPQPLLLRRPERNFQALPPMWIIQKLRISTSMEASTSSTCTRRGKAPG